jgi:hypothetical protein
VSLLAEFKRRRRVEEKPDAYERMSERYGTPQAWAAFALPDRDDVLDCLAVKGRYTGPLTCSCSQRSLCARCRVWHCAAPGHAPHVCGVTP